MACPGQTPLTLQTGNRDNNTVKKRMNCHRGARCAVYLRAKVNNLRESSGWHGAYSRKCKQRGDREPKRFRKLGKKLVSILYRCLVDNIHYDPEIYTKNLYQKV